ncbi:MAG: DUF6127 family protein [Sphingopyxis sp.]
MSGPWSDIASLSDLSHAQARAVLAPLLEQASEAGATLALDRLGLTDPKAREDIHELRELLSAWRDAKRSAWRAAVDWLVRGCLALLLVALAVKLGFGAMLR